MSSLVKSVTRKLLKEGVYLANVVPKFYISQPEKRMRSLSHEELEELERKIGFDIWEYSVDGDISIKLNNKNLNKLKDSMEMCDNLLFDLSFVSFFVGEGHGSLGGPDSFYLYPKSRNLYRKGSYTFFSYEGGKYRKRIENIMEKKKIEKT